MDYDISPKENEEVIDAAGKYITPGFIDAHSHICISEEGMGEVGDVAAITRMLLPLS